MLFLINLWLFYWHVLNMSGASLSESAGSEVWFEWTWRIWACMRSIVHVVQSVHVAPNAWILALTGKHSEYVKHPREVKDLWNYLQLFMGSLNLQFPVCTFSLFKRLSSPSFTPVKPQVKYIGIFVRMDFLDVQWLYCTWTAGLTAVSYLFSLSRHQCFYVA